MEDRPVNIDSMAIPRYSPYLCVRNKEESK